MNREDNNIWYVIAAVVFFSTGGLAVVWHRCIDWLQRYDVLVPPARAEVALPHASGAGLDTFRLVALTLLVLLGLVLTRSVLRRRAQEATS